MNSRLAIVSALVLLASAVGCTVPEEPAVRLTDAFVPDEECAENDVGTYTGSVDLTFTSSVVMGFRYASDFQPQSTTANDQELAGPSRNDVIFTEMEVSYESDPAVALTGGTRPVYLYAHSGSGGDDSWIILDLFTTTVAKELRDAILSGTEEYTVLVRFRLRGETSVGQEVETREVVFPVTVRETGFTCPAGQVITGEGPCGNLGQGVISCEAP